MCNKRYKRSETKNLPFNWEGENLSTLKSLSFYVYKSIKKIISVDQQLVYSFLTSGMIFDSGDILQAKECDYDFLFCT